MNAFAIFSTRHWRSSSTPELAQKELALQVPLGAALTAIKGYTAAETKAAGTVFRDKLRDGSEGPEMVVISASSFRMGDIQGGGGSDERGQDRGVVLRVDHPCRVGRAGT